ncbi:hypothetical protein CCP3SC1_2540001 [Gammaproteobacteria bacterium]
MFNDECGDDLTWCEFVWSIQMDHGNDTKRNNELGLPKHMEPAARDQVCMGRVCERPVLEQEQNHYDRLYDDADA